MYSQQTSTVKTWFFMGMAMFYVFFLLAVMKVFDGSEAAHSAIASVKKPVESIAVVDRDDMYILGDLKSGFEQEMSSHVVRVPHHHYHHQNTVYPKLQDDSQIDDIIIFNLHATAAHVAGLSISTNDNNKLSSRLREPMLRRGNPILRRILSWARGAFYPKRSLRIRNSSSSRKGVERIPRTPVNIEGVIVTRSDWAISRLR